MRKLVAESLNQSINENLPQYAEDPIRIPRKTRKGEDTKYRVFVFEHPLNIAQNKLPQYVWTENPELFRSIKNREKGVYFDGKPVPAEKHGNLVPYGNYSKTGSRTRNKPWFTWDEWKGKDKFGGFKDNWETRNIKLKGSTFARYVSKNLTHS